MSSYEIFRSPKDGQFYWHLEADNGEVVAQSEGYTRKVDAQRGAQDAHRAALSASQPLITVRKVKKRS